MKIATLIFIFLSFSIQGYCQLWKQYSDSAKYFRDQNNITKAIINYTKAKDELTKDSSDTESYASICTSLGKLYMRTGNYDTVESLYIKARQIRESVNSKMHPAYAASCNNLGTFYMDIGQYKTAERLYIEAKEIREKTIGKKSSDYAGSCNNLALLYLYMGLYDKSELLFLEAINIDTILDGKESRYYAIDCDNLALLYGEIGQFEKAYPLHLESKMIKEKIFTKNSREYAKSCDNLAGLFLKMRQYEKAILLDIEALQIREIVLTKNDPEYARSCNSLATDYATMGNYEKAKPLFLEALKIRERVLTKEHPDYALSCNNMGSLYSDLNDYKKAQTFFLIAFNIRKRVLGKEHPYYISTCNDIAILYRNMHKFEETNFFYTLALKAKKSQLKKFFQFTSESEKQLYLQQNTKTKNYFFSFYSTDFNPSRQGACYNASLTNRNLILASFEQLRKNIYISDNSTVKTKYNNWIALRERISFWYTKPIAGRPAYVKTLEEEANTLEKELTRLSSGFKNEQKKSEVNWKNIQQSLKTNEVAIEFVEFRYSTGKRTTDSTHYIALVLRKDTPEPVLVRLFEQKQLDKIFNNTESLATDNRINTLYKGNRSLYNLIWKPLEKYLTGISKVYFASAGNLFKISFAALPVNVKQVLGDKHQLIQLNTTTTVTDNTQSFITATDKIQLYGGINYDADSATLKQAVASYQSNTESSRSLPSDLERGAGFQFLPGTQKETESIKKEIGNTGIPLTILSGINATEESVKALTGKNSPSVLHIATHGFFFPDPKEDKRDSIQRKFETSGKVFKQSDNPLFRSGLLFAGANNAWQGKPIVGIEDGILTAYEVSNLYLPNTKLVVLSACETALGDIQGSEGVYGLQRAFKMAGVQNLVMSLWKVPDAETAEFMQLFYKNLFAKQTISNAFYNTQKVMKDKYRAEPYKWAAWVLVR